MAVPARVDHAVPHVADSLLLIALANPQQLSAGIGRLQAHQLALLDQQLLDIRDLIEDERTQRRQERRRRRLTTAEPQEGMAS